MQAITTHYKGYAFRSRLEARWAVAFDFLGLSWQYEPEGYVLSDGPYLPDFTLADHRFGTVFVEVKPSPSKETDWSRIKGMHRETGNPVLLLTDFRAVQRHSFYAVKSAFLEGEEWYAERHGRLCYAPVQLTKSGISVACPGETQFIWTKINEDYERAIAAGRSARFEFGQKGAFGS